MPEIIVDFRKDPLRKAKKIKCDECNICEWGPGGYCTYGGPFTIDVNERNAILEKWKAIFGQDP